MPFLFIGLHREAERFLKSSLKDQPMSITQFELANNYINLSLPQSALKCLTEGSWEFCASTSLMMAQIYAGMDRMEQAADLFRKVMQLDGTNVQAVTGLASFYFNAGKLDSSLRCYQRLLQSGACGSTSAMVWSNVAVCCLHGATDLSLGCFVRALEQASDDDSLHDVWYNFSFLALKCGDVQLAVQSLRIALALQPDHEGARKNLPVFERHAAPGGLVANVVTSRF
jgi:Tfp pilus assembly protein PilF